MIRKAKTPEQMTEMYAELADRLVTPERYGGLVLAEVIPLHPNRSDAPA